MSTLCIEADFATLRNCMADNRLDSLDRQTMGTLINYGSRPVITAREVTNGKSGCLFRHPNYRSSKGSLRRGLGPSSATAASHNAQDHTCRTHPKNPQPEANVIVSACVKQR